jgi:hypothetical protein
LVRGSREKKKQRQSQVFPYLDPEEAVAKKHEHRRSLEGTYTHR